MKLRYMVAHWAWDAGIYLLRFSQARCGQRIRFMVVKTEPIKRPSSKVPCE